MDREKFFKDLGLATDTKSDSLNTSKRKRSKKNKKKASLQSLPNTSDDDRIKRERVETVIFQDPDKKNLQLGQSQDKIKKIKNKESHEEERKNMEIEMKGYRYDVIRFAAAKDKSDNAEEFDREALLAIHLGAKKPRKGVYVNYKDLIEKKKTEKLIKMEELKNDESKKSKKPDKNKKSNKKQVKTKRSRKKY